MLSTLVDIRLEAIHIGMAVGVRFMRIGSFTLPMFAPLNHSLQGNNTHATQ